MVGKPDKIKNNVPKAYIVLKKEYSYNEELLKELIRICEVNLRETLRPDEYIFIEKMPVTNMGKINISNVEKEENINVLVRRKIN